VGREHARQDPGVAARLSTTWWCTGPPGARDVEAQTLLAPLRHENIPNLKNLDGNSSACPNDRGNQFMLRISGAPWEFIFANRRTNRSSQPGG